MCLTFAASQVYLGVHFMRQVGSLIRMNLVLVYAARWQHMSEIYLAIFSEQKITKLLITLTQAKEKLSTQLKPCKNDLCFTKFKNSQILLIKLATDF